MSVFPSCGFHRDRHRRLPARGTKASDVRLLEHHDETAVAITQGHGRLLVGLRVGVDEELA